MKNSLRTKPQQERAIATINSILKASKRVLLSEGYEKFTTNRVAAESGFNIGTVYRYFPDKENIILKLYTERLDEAYVFFINHLTDKSIWDNRTWNTIEDFFGSILARFIANHTVDDHYLAVELTKATVLNQHIQHPSGTYEKRAREAIRKTIQKRFKLKADNQQIQFLLSLGIHLALMVSMQPEKKRHYTAEQVATTFSATIRTYFKSPLTS